MDKRKRTVPLCLLKVCKIDKGTPKETDKPEIDIPEAELERLKRDIYRSDKEKFLLIVEMFRRSALLKKAKIERKT